LKKIAEGVGDGSLPRISEELLNQLIEGILNRKKEEVKFDVSEEMQKRKEALKDFDIQLARDIAEYYKVAPKYVAKEVIPKISKDVLNAFEKIYKKDNSINLGEVFEKISNGEIDRKDVEEFIKPKPSMERALQNLYELREFVSRAEAKEPIKEDDIKYIQELYGRVVNQAVSNLGNVLTQEQKEEAIQDVLDLIDAKDYERMYEILNEIEQVLINPLEILRQEQIKGEITEQKKAQQLRR
jgi:hypothetical protein